MAGPKQKYEYPEGDTYIGQWNNEGKKHGVGTLHLMDGTIYEGNFINGLFSGIGTLTFPDGTLYEGQFQRGKYSGYGVYTRIDEMKFEGRFKNGKVSGPGLITFPDGGHGRPRKEGIFEGTKLIRRETVTDSIEKARKAARKARDLKI